MPTSTSGSGVLDGLNEQQQAAVCHDQSPLLIIAGAGTGKTRTLVHRVAHEIQEGVDPERILLLTFTRRAAADMLRRVDSLLRQLAARADSGNRARLASRRIWGGTFHAVATRLLRSHGNAIGLDAAFSIHDRGDSEDLLDVVRTELRLHQSIKRFPKKRTCLAIYSHCVSSRRPIEDVLHDHFPWCSDYADELKELFCGYVDRKEATAALDYDDLLLFWHGLLADQQASEQVRQRFDCVLVDEYQDTNHLQADILRLLRPDGRGLSVVGDDAQAIYSFRAATIRNILDFPKQYPGTTVVKLEQNYRSTPPILAATNAVIAEASDRFEKNLWSARSPANKPQLIACEDEDEQAEFLIHKILEHREAGLDLREQAVLFRTAHHSMVLEAELARHNIPFVKYGGLKFIETAHVKDLMAFLRLADNPRDLVAGLRVLMLLPGIGPQKSRQLMQSLTEHNSDFDIWAKAKPPAAAETLWPKFVKLMRRLARASSLELPAQVNLVRKFYAPLLEERFDHAEPRLRDLEQLEQLAARFADRQTMLAEITLDPPASSEDFAGPPELDEDYLILSTIHSAKGLEWDSVFVIHAADGNIPSDMATKNPEQIEEERRLFYVALSRAKNSLYVCCPHRYYHFPRGDRADRHGYALLTRFISDRVKPNFDAGVAFPARPRQNDSNVRLETHKRANIRAAVKAMWATPKSRSSSATE